MIEMIFNLHKVCAIFIIVIPYYWNKFISNMKSLIIIISEWVFLKVMTINMWQIKNLTNNHFQMEDDKKCEVEDGLCMNVKLKLGALSLELRI